MNGNIDVGGIDRRAKTAGYDDGLLEIFAAAVLLTIALAWIVNAAFVGIAAAFVALLGWKALDKIKARITYPRIGYYREHSDEPKRTARGILLFMAGAFLLMVFVILISGGLADPTEWRRAAPLMSGISLAGGFWYTADRSGLLRYRLIAGLSVVSGVLLWWFGSGESYVGVVWHLVILSVPLALVGIWSLVRFVRTHPVRELPVDG
jgi:hypothetical protein